MAASAKSRKSRKSKSRAKAGALFSPSELDAGRPHSSRRSISRKAPPPWEPAVGELVGNWQLIKELGAGGMGSVWEAVNTKNEYVAAMKFMHTDAASVPRYRADFFREGVIDNLVDQSVGPQSTGPGTAPVYDTGRAPGGQPYLVMEKLDGQSLGTLARSGQHLEPPVVARLLAQALPTLEAAHTRSIIHRDLKPDNLFLTSAGDVKVLDFGLAQYPGDQPRTPGQLLGTPGYAAPEQSMGYLVTSAADVFGWGATGYRLLTGRAPFRSATAVGAGEAYLDSMPTGEFDRLLQGEPPDYSTYPGCPVPPVRSLAPDTPPALARMIDESLACDPDARPSMTVLRHDLEQALRAELSK